jgi:hypothetical protein
MRYLLLLLACGGEPVTPEPEETDVPPDTDLPDTDPPPETDVPPDPSTLPPVLSVSPPPGVLDRDGTITLTCSDPTATIWYTLDGLPPEVGASTPYTGPISADRTRIVRAVVETDHGRDALAGSWVRMTPSVGAFSSNLPVIVLWTTEAAPEEKLETYTPFFFSTFEPAAGGRVAWPSDATVSAPAGLKVRGSSSAGYPKRPYRLELWEADSFDDADVALLGMPEEGDWVLGAPLDFDRALMRDPLIFALSNLIGRYAPRTRFAELFVVDGGRAISREDYKGVYVVTERIERDAERVDITGLGPADLQEPEISGGYLFKEDRTGPGEVGFWAGSAGQLVFQQPFVLVDPEESAADPLQQAWLAGYLDELGAALTSPGFTAPGTGRHYRELIDVNAWIDHHILNVLAKNPDAFRLSGYLHKDREGPLIAGPLWDFDRTMGCSSDFRAEDPTGWDASNLTPDTTYVFQHGFWGGLFRDPEFAAAWLARWRDLLDNTLTVAAIHQEIDNMAAELREAAPRNFEAWPDYPPRGGSHAAEVALLKQWIAERHAWIRGCVEREAPWFCPR